MYIYILFDAIFFWFPQCAIDVNIHFYRTVSTKYIWWAFNGGFIMNGHLFIEEERRESCGKSWSCFIIPLNSDKHQRLWPGRVHLGVVSGWCSCPRQTCVLTLWIFCNLVLWITNLAVLVHSLRLSRCIRTCEICCGKICDFNWNWINSVGRGEKSNENVLIF